MAKNLCESALTIQSFHPDFIFENYDKGKSIQDARKMAGR